MLLLSDRESSHVVLLSDNMRNTYLKITLKANQLTEYGLEKAVGGKYSNCV